MRNLRISAHLVDGGVMEDMFRGLTGKELIHTLITDDWGPPPLGISIDVETDDGRRVSVGIPYDDRDMVSVSIKPAAT